MTGVLTTCLAGYMTLVNTQYRSAMRSQSWSMAITTAEAGIEEGFAQLYFGSFTNYSNNGWSTATNGITRVRTLSTNSYYVATIVTNASPALLATGYVRIPGQSNYVSRTVSVTLTNQSLFQWAVLSKGTLSGSGSGVTVDSYDSSNPLYNTNGRYDSSKRHDHGYVSSINGSIDIPNIYGYAATGPTGSASGTVGDLQWFQVGNSGIETGHYRNDLNITVADVTPPFTSGWTPTSGTYNGQSYTYLLGTGDYATTSISLSGHDSILVTGNARLYLSGTLSMGGQASIEIATNATLAVYVNGSSASIDGNGIINDPGNSANFQLYGTSNLTSLSLSGNGTFIGTLYAPEAALTLNGGGSSNTDFSGAAVVGSATMHGHFSIHYDEALAKQGGSYAVARWDEL
jgi:hypothetical protein